MNRLERLLAVGTLGLATVIGGQAIFPLEAYAAEQSNQVEKRKEEISMDEINKYMAMDSVEDILGNSVEYITPNEWQRKVDKSNKDGVVIFAYKRREKGEYGKRSAIIIKKLVENFY